MKNIFIPIITIILLAANIGIGVFLLTASNASQISVSHLEALRRNSQNQQLLESDLLAYGPQISQLQQILPGQDQIPEFIQFVTDTATKNSLNLTLNFATNQPTKTKDNLYVIPFVLSGNADPQKLPNFLIDLNQDQYQIRFRQADISESTIKLQGDVFVNP